MVWINPLFPCNGSWLQPGQHGDVSPWNEENSDRPQLIDFWNDFSFPQFYLAEQDSQIAVLNFFMGQNSCQWKSKFESANFRLWVCKLQRFPSPKPSSAQPTWRTWGGNVQFAPWMLCLGWFLNLLRHQSSSLLNCFPLAMWGGSSSQFHWVKSSGIITYGCCQV